MLMAKVTVYSTPSCPWCTRAKRYLSEHGISYSDYDVSKDKAAAEKMVKRTGQMGVPVLEIGSNIVIGFDKNKIDRLLSIK
jgi:glutaredoxin-like YruB-family protein